jgi:large subunit ribosomal protein L22
MNKAQAKLMFIRITPTKMNRVAKLVRGKKVSDAQVILKFSTLAASLPLRKLLNSAVANYKSKFNKEDLETIQINEILVNQGPTYKRMRPRARGMGARILKRSCHVILTVSEIVEKIKPKKITVKSAKTEKKDVKNDDKKEVKKDNETDKKVSVSVKPKQNKDKKVSASVKFKQNNDKKVEKKVEKKVDKKVKEKTDKNNSKNESKKTDKKKVSKKQASNKGVKK